MAHDDGKQFYPVYPAGYAFFKIAKANVQHRPLFPVNIKGPPLLLILLTKAVLRHA